MRTNQLLFLTIVALLLGMSNLLGQSRLTGTVLDGADNAKLEKATITLLSPKDSILQSFIWSKEGGKFTLSKLDTGNYKMIISYPQYADLVRDIHIREALHDLGDLKLSKSALLIDEVLVNRKAPIVIKGDTLEYDANSFKVDKDAKVEDLLKVLPGITVGADGKITAQGKEVKKVLLDGEEFFGDDPTLITKNIRSDMVDKVQVYEKKSDLADRTGIDDGERTQTIDIKLKENMKKGMFGQALAGVGTDKYYAGKVMANQFKGSRKVALYGITANDGMVGLNFEDGQKYGVGSNANVEMMDGGGIMISSSGSDEMSSWSGNFNGNGVPKALNMGASYSDKSKNDKHKINVNYRRSQLDVQNNSLDVSQNNLPEVALINRSNGFTDRDSKGNTANLRYDMKVDSMSDLTVKMGYRDTDRENFSRSNSSQENLDLSPITKTTMRSNELSKDKNINANVLLTRRFKKERRSLTLNANISTGENNSGNQFYSQTDRASDGSEDIVDQFKNNESTSNNYRASLNYTEPFSKSLTGTLGYAFTGDKSSTLNESFNKNAVTGVYDQRDESVLNDFDFKTISNGMTTGLNWKNEKLTLNISNQLYFDNVRRDYNNLATSLERDQISIIPTGSIRYNFTKNKSISFNYNGRTIQPSLIQIEPLKQNSQQNIKYFDNLDLEAGFRHSYNLYFNSYKPLRDVGFYASVWASQQTNAINSKMDYNKNTGITNIQYVNVDKSNWNVNFYSGYRIPVIKKIALSMNFGGNVNYSNTFNYLAVNNEEAVLNNSEAFTISPEIGFSSNRANKWSLWGNVTPGVRKESSSVQPELNNTSFVVDSRIEGSYTFPKNFKLALNMDQTYQAATKTLDAFSQVNLGGYVSKKFLKDKSLEAQIFVNDILNQNKGIRRYQNGNMFVQSSNDVLRRYGMLKLIYNFTTMKGGKE